jgi:hypothetical protein
VAATDSVARGKEARKQVARSSHREWTPAPDRRPARDVLEAQRSVLEPYADNSPFAHQGRRVVEGQRLMQAAGDIFLGWVRARGTDRSIEVETMDADGLALYGLVCG